MKPKTGEKSGSRTASRSPFSERCFILNLKRINRTIFELIPLFAFKKKRILIPFLASLRCTYTRMPAPPNSAGFPFFEGTLYFIFKIIFHFIFKLMFHFILKNFKSKFIYYSTFKTRSSCCLSHFNFTKKSKLPKTAAALFPLSAAALQQRQQHCSSSSNIAAAATLQQQHYSSSCSTAAAWSSRAAVLLLAATASFVFLLISKNTNQEQQRSKCLLFNLFLF